MEAETYIVREIHYFDRGGKHLKTLTVSGHKKYPNGIWRAAFMRMENLLTGKSTNLT